MSSSIRFVVGKKEADGTYTFIKGSHGKVKTFTKKLEEATVYTKRGVGTAANEFKNLGFKKLRIEVKLLLDD